ncbi:MAG: putative Ig domain-containing protein [Bacteriovoracaceae bacterium]
MEHSLPPLIAKNLPGTNSFSATTGILNWTPSLSAVDSGDDTDYSITISASDSLGGTDSKTFTLTVAIVAAPTYGSLNPASPSSTSTSPVITGTASSDTSTCNFLFRFHLCY